MQFCLSKCFTFSKWQKQQFFKNYNQFKFWNKITDERWQSHWMNLYSVENCYLQFSTDSIGQYPADYKFLYNEDFFYSFKANKAITQNFKKLYQISLRFLKKYFYSKFSIKVKWKCVQKKYWNYEVLALIFEIINKK